jgi:hypothetical protein
MTGKMIVFYCAFGSAGRRARHIEGGMAAWLTAGERGGVTRCDRAGRLSAGGRMCVDLGRAEFAGNCERTTDSAASYP